jgi:hypothetical protein
VSDRTAPVELGGLDTPGAPATVAVAAGRVYLGESTGGGALRVIDPADPAAPTELGAIATSKTRAVEIAGRHAFIADEELDGPGGLRVVDVADPAALAIVGHYEEDCRNAVDLALLDQRVLVACGYDGFHLVDVSDPARPRRVAVVPAPDGTSAWSVAVRGRQAALGHDQGVIVVDLADPAAPREVSRMATATAVRALLIPFAGRVVAAAGLGGVYQWQLE